MTTDSTSAHEGRDVQVRSATEICAAWTGLVLATAAAIVALTLVVGRGDAQAPAADVIAAFAE